MLLKVLQRMLARGDTYGLREKIDVFFAVGRITEGEYQALVAQL